MFSRKSSTAMDALLILPAALILGATVKPIRLEVILVFLGLMSFFDVDEKYGFEHIEVSELRLIMDLCWRI